MKSFHSALFLLTFGAGLAASASAEAASAKFRHCARWTTPTCLTMKALDGKTYELLDAGPAFVADGNTLSIVLGDPVGDIGLCFLPTARVKTFKILAGACPP